MTDFSNDAPWHEPWSDDEQRIGFLLSRAQKLARQTFDRRMRKLEITAPQFEMLLLLLKHEGASSADLARQSALTAQAVNGVIINLEQRGLVQRTAHPVHGRILQTRLTAAGREILGKCVALERDLDHKLTEGLDEAQQRVVRDWLNGTIASLRREARSRRRKE